MRCQAAGDADYLAATESLKDRPPGARVNCCSLAIKAYASGKDTFNNNGYDLSGRLGLMV